MINPAVYGIRDTHPSWPAARRRSRGFVVFFSFLGWVGWGGVGLLVGWLVVLCRDP